MIPIADFFLVLFTVFSVGFDIGSRRIPNWLILLGISWGILVNAWKGDLFNSFLGLGLGIGILIIPFALGWLGAGDVKLLGAIGAILGVKWLPRVFFYSALVGGLLAIMSIFTKGMNPKAFKDALYDFKLMIMSRGAVLPDTVNERRMKGARTVPYGVAIGLGTLVAFYVDPRGEWAGF
ncbi:MAG: A24 family peptidase [Candidatus Binatia bacterium]